MTIRTAMILMCLMMVGCGESEDLSNVAEHYRIEAESLRKKLDACESKPEKECPEVARKNLGVAPELIVKALGQHVEGMEFTPLRKEPAGWLREHQSAGVVIKIWGKEETSRIAIIANSAEQLTFYTGLITAIVTPGWKDEELAHWLTEAFSSIKPNDAGLLGYTVVGGVRVNYIPVFANTLSMEFIPVD